MDRYQLAQNPVPQNTSVTVKATNSEDVLVDRFAELFTNLGSADVSIMCGRNHDVLKAHRYVLCSGSKYFRDALKVSPCKHPVVVVKNLSVDTMSRILEYIYLGKVTLKSENELLQFVSSAKYLLVTGIMDDQYSVGN